MAEPTPQTEGFPDVWSESQVQSLKHEIQRQFEEVMKRESSDLIEDRSALRIGGVHSLRYNQAWNEGANVLASAVAPNLDMLVLVNTQLVTELRADVEHPVEVKIDNFELITKDKPDGGLLMYVRKGIEYSVTSSWESDERSQLVEISITKPFRIDLISIHNLHRTHQQKVLDLMAHFLKRNKRMNIPIMFVGDLESSDAKKRQFERFQRVYGLQRLVRETPDHPTCLTMATNIEHALGPAIDVTRSFTPTKVFSCILKRPMSSTEFSSFDTGEYQTASLPHGEINGGSIFAALLADQIECVLTLNYEFEYKVEKQGNRISSLSFRVIFDQTNSKKKLDKIGQLKLDQMKLQYDDATIVSKRCTVYFLHKQSVQPAGDAASASLSSQVGAFNCSFVKTSANEKVDQMNKFLSKYYVCDSKQCLKLFSTQTALIEHEMADHPSRCPYCFDFSPHSKNLDKHINKKHSHALHRCSATSCYAQFPTLSARDCHEETDHDTCMTCLQLDCALHGSTDKGLQGLKTTCLDQNKGAVESSSDQPSTVFVEEKHPPKYGRIRTQLRRLPSFYKQFH